MTASFRVHFVAHAPQRVSGQLIERYQSFFLPSVSAIGRTEEEVLTQLEDGIAKQRAEWPGAFERLLWQEDFGVRVVRADVRPLTAVGKQAVIGVQQIPLRLSYVWAAIKSGGYRIMLPRVGFNVIVEDLSIASDVVREAVAASLAGEEGKWLYSFRYEGEEYVREWSPSSLRALRMHSSSAEEEEFPVVNRVAEDWVNKAAGGKLEACIGSDVTFDALWPAFQRETIPSVLLVGPAGVGKTTFVRRLARALLELRRGKKGARKHVRLWATSADRILAGMAYLGMWQQRCLKLVQELSHEGDILYLERLTDLVRPQSDGAAIADLLSDAIESGEISVIAECNAVELERLQQTRASLIDAMTVVRVQEPGRGQVLTTMLSYATRQRADMPIREQGFERAFQHLAAFRPDSAFPGKAFQFFDWLCRHQRAHDDDEVAAPLTAADMSRAYSEYSGLPMELLSDETGVDTKQVASALAAAVVGQTEACDTAARVIVRMKAGLNDPARPIGTLLFVGPTGVGKTELAKQLARFMFGSTDRLLRLDMSEYAAPGAGMRLLQVGPQARTLAQRARQQPLSVVLFDEIEKAHSEVFDMLLGILDEGRLTDENGQLVDLRMTLMVMTSNLGAGQSQALGFGGGANSPDYRQAVRRHFRPELFNRIDHVVSFAPLPLDKVEVIVDMEVARLATREGLVRRGIQLRVTDAARKRLAELGFHPEMGARPLKRVIEERLVGPLAVRLAADTGFSNVVVRVGTADDADIDIVV